MRTTITCAIAASALIILTCPAPASPAWLMPGYDLCNTKDVRDSTLRPPLELAWKVEMPSPVENSPLVIGERVYAGSGHFAKGKLYELGLKDGAIVRDIPYDFFYVLRGASLFAHGERLYISGDKHGVEATQKGGFFSIDLKTDVRGVWCPEDEWPVYACPKVYQDKIYLLCSNGGIYCVDEDYQTVWKTPTGIDLSVLKKPAGVPQAHFESSPAIRDGVLYVGCKDGKLYAVKTKDGAPLWTFEAQKAIETSPALSGDTLVFGSRDGNVYGCDARTGKEKWRHATGGWVTSSPAVSQGRVYAGSYDGRLYCLDLETGKRVWAYQTGGKILSSPCVANGVVYVGSWDGKVYGVDAGSGKERWSYETASCITASPVVAGDTLLIGSCDMNLYAFRTEERAAQ